ncbi:hypothetical protein [Paenibacillus sp. FSL K6-2524]|uniref:hypothetical protein n=1 Tax=Paenibacillus sp. FSL K6-2524 TaxID=2954516 RepID=UPI0030FAD04E
MRNKMADYAKNLKHSDLKIVGDSGSNGGVFNKVNIVGNAEINGDIDCQTFKCTGTAEIGGSLTSNVFKTTGDVITKGSLRGGEVNLTGNLNIRGSLTVTKAQLNGEIQIEEGIAGDEIGIYGNCTVKGDCQVEHFRLKGAAQVDGMLNAERVEMKLLGLSRAKEIVGGHIRIQPHSSWRWMSLLKNSGAPELKVEVIEGDVIWLEHTVADVVRGGDVTIGPGCRIGLVEYRGTFQQDKQSDIAESRNVG